MFKFMFSAILCLAFACPTVLQAQDCGCCDEAPVCCQKTRKKLALVNVSREVTRLKRVCETDCCGCSHSRLARVSECVSRKKLALVDVAVDPCRRNLLQRVGDKVKSLGNRGGCCDSCGSSGCDSGCGCDAAPSCGCDGGMGSHPSISYPSESYGGGMGSPVEMSFPSEYGVPTDAMSPVEGSVIIQ